MRNMWHLLCPVLVDCLFFFFLATPIFSSASFDNVVSVLSVFGKKLPTNIAVNSFYLIAEKDQAGSTTEFLHSCSLLAFCFAGLCIRQKLFSPQYKVFIK